MIEIPLQQSPFQKLSTVLDGQNCEIEVRQLGNRIYCSLKSNDVQIVTNAIALNFTEINPYPNQFFNGSLFFYDSEGDEPPKWRELGTRFKLMYIRDNERRFKRMTAELLR